MCRVKSAYRVSSHSNSLNKKSAERAQNGAQKAASLLTNHMYRKGVKRLYIPKENFKRIVKFIFKSDIGKVINVLENSGYNVSVSQNGQVLKIKAQ